MRVAYGNVWHLPRDILSFLYPSIKRSTPNLPQRTTGEIGSEKELKKSLKGPETRNSLQVCQFFCVNGQVLSLRNSLQGRHAFRPQNREVVWPNGLTAVEAADLSDPEAIHVLVRQLDARNLHGDVLVNNAGLGESELFERSPWSRIRQIVEVNIVAMLRLSHHFLPAMISRGHGAILNIGSGAGYAAMPNAAVYTASKHFVRAFTESLRAQHRRRCDSRARHFPNHCARMRRRYCSGIRERFARNFSWPELSLADENAAPDATTTSRNSCRPSSSPDSLSGNQTRSLRPSPTSHVYAS